MKLLPEVAPGLLVIQIQIQAVCQVCCKEFERIEISTGQPRYKTPKEYIIINHEKINLSKNHKKQFVCSLINFTKPPIQYNYKKESKSKISRRIEVSRSRALPK